MIIMSGILSVVIGNKCIEEIKHQVGSSLSETAYQMADKLDSFMWARSGEIYTLSQLDALHNFNDIKGIQKLLEQLKVNFPSFTWIGLTDTKGTVVASTQGILSGVDISQRPVFKEGIKGKFVGDVHEAVLLAKLLPNPTGEAMKFVDVSIPVIDSKGNKKGVLAAHLSWQSAHEIEESILKPLQYRKNIDMYVVSSKDNVVLLGQKDMIGKPLNLEGLNAAKQDINQWSVETWNDGKNYVTGFALGDGYMNYEGLGWKIVVRQSLHSAYGSARELQAFIILAGVFFALIFSAFIWFMAGKISTPIHNISKTAEMFRLGEQTQVPQQKGIKEIELLSVSLRELLNSLARSETALGEMETVAHHDHLTGIPNRKGLEKYLNIATATARTNGTVLTFLCLDLDGFKSVNDTYGHYTGDVLLQSVSQRLTKMIREDEIAARLGGDEFVVIIQSTAEKAVEDGNTVAERIITVLNEPFLLNGYTIHVGCSVGYAVWNDGEQPHDILQYADEALYVSKKTGKNKATFYDSRNSY
jgi:diguanylate cyclase (GGDEF)-like protein